MKLKNELPMIITAFKAVQPQIDSYAKQLYASKDYNDFKTRLAYDVFYSVFRGEKRCDFYDMLEAKYPDYNDKHLQTLLKTALEAVYPDIKNFK